MIGGLFSSVKFEVSGGGPIEFIDPFHPKLLTYKILASTGDDFESFYIRDRLRKTKYEIGLKIILKRISIDNYIYRE